MPRLGDHLTLALCALGVACAASGDMRADQPVSLAIFPFRPLDAAVEDVSEVQSALAGELRGEAGGGFELVPAGHVEDALTARRIRVVETFPPDTAAFLAESLDGAMLLTGTLLYSRSSPTPAAALMLRLFDAEGRRRGSLLWMERGEDMVNAWGLDPAESLPELFGRGAATLRDRVVERSDRASSPGRPRVAVLPFDSTPENQASGLMAALVAAHTLEEEFGVDVVEPGDLLEGFRRARIRTLEMLGIDGARRLAEEVDVRWFVTGTVLEIEYGSGLEPPPRLSVIMRLFDAKEQRTVRSVCVNRSGDQGEIVLGAGLAPHPILNMQTALREGLSKLESAWLSSLES